MYASAASQRAASSSSGPNRSAARPGTIKPVYGAQHPPLRQPADTDVLRSVGDTPTKKKTPVPSQSQTRLDSAHKNAAARATDAGETPHAGPTTPSRPPTGRVPGVASHGDSFDDFASRTSDAWDAADDDLLAIAASNLNVKATTHSHSHPKILRKSRGVAGVQSGGAIVIEADALQKTPPGRRMSGRRRSDLTDAGSSAITTPNSKGPAPGMALRLGPAGNPAPTPPEKSTRGILASITVPDRPTARLSKFKDLLSASNPSLDELRRLSWNGIPKDVRPVAWQLLTGYLPPNVDRREATLDRKRLEYFGFVDQYFSQRNSSMHQDTFRQIHIDIPRMNPLIPLFQKSVVQEIFERILFIWAVRHPASGYVQGMNDLVTPFFVVFLSQFLEVDVSSREKLNAKEVDLSGVEESQLKSVEADSFWCFSKLLDGIQDNYTFAQPGIQTKVLKLKDLTKRIDGDLHHHMENQTVEYLQFAFRWMNNLLMREMPLHCTIRLWDTYWSEPDGFAVFHLYVCAAFLNLWSKELMQQRDFQGIMIFLQNPPTTDWGEEEISLMLAEAFRLKFLFAEAPNHLRETTESSAAAASPAQLQPPPHN